MKLTDPEIALVRELQKDIPMTAEPFAEIGARIGMTGAEVLARLDEWKASGVVRRYGAAVRHYKLGYSANAMTVWNVPADRVEEIGRIFLKRPEISHCYERTTIPGFAYNVFAMVHATKKEDVDRVVGELVEASAIDDYQVLWSTREFKRDSMYYFVEED